MKVCFDDINPGDCNDDTSIRNHEDCVTLFLMAKSKQILYELTSLLLQVFLKLKDLFREIFILPFVFTPLEHLKSIEKNSK